MMLPFLNSLLIHIRGKHQPNTVRNFYLLNSVFHSIVIVLFVVVLYKCVELSLTLKKLNTFSSNKNIAHVPQTVLKRIPKKLPIVLLQTTSHFGYNQKSFIGSMSIHNITLKNKMVFRIYGNLSRFISTLLFKRYNSFK